MAWRQRADVTARIAAPLRSAVGEHERFAGPEGWHFADDHFARGNAAVRFRRSMASPVLPAPSAPHRPHPQLASVALGRNRVVVAATIAAAPESGPNSARPIRSVAC